MSRVRIIEGSDNKLINISINEYSDTHNSSSNNPILRYLKTTYTLKIQSFINIL